MLLHHRRTSHAHGVSRVTHKKNVGITVHGKPGAHMHRSQLPGFVKRDAWKRRAQAQGQG